MHRPFLVVVVCGVCCSAFQQGAPEAPRAPSTPGRNLTLREHAIAGGVARCAAQTAVHPLNVAKTMLQTHGGGEALRKALSTPAGMRQTFSRGIGAQALLSLPNGAINFWALECGRRFTTASLNSMSLSAPAQAIDIVSASFGTAIGTLVSLPQSVLNDQIMSGKHKNLRQAVRAVGWRGLYPPSTWRAALLSKVPSYALNWACYQQLRRWRAESRNCSVDDFSTVEDMAIGAVASSISVCVMIPLDTVKVRMTTLNFGRGVAYSGVVDAISRMLKEEGVRAFYRGLPPRLLSVVPMTAIQFAVYELAKRRLPSVRESAESFLAETRASISDRGLFATAMIRPHLTRTFPLIPESMARRIPRLQASEATMPQPAATAFVDNAARSRRFAFRLWPPTNSAVGTKSTP